MKNKLDISNVTNAWDVVRIYYSRMEAHDAETKKAHDTFRGDALKRELVELEGKKPNLKKAVEDLEMYRENALLDLEAIRMTAFDSKNLTTDYQLLTLPVTLTADEILMLHTKHIENPLYCRALQQYCGTHGIDDLLPLTDNIDYRKRAIEKCFVDMIDLVERPDAFALGFMESADYIQRVADRLSDGYVPNDTSDTATVITAGDAVKASEPEQGGATE